MLYTTLLVIIAFAILRFAAKVVSKLIAIVLLIAAVLVFMYHKGLGPFEQNHISIVELEVKYCQLEKDPEKCECIVKPLKADIEKRFTQQELEELKKNRIKGAYILNKSFQANKEMIALCLAEKDAIGEIKEFQDDLLPFDNKIVKKLSKIITSIQKKAEESWQDLQNDKEEIDKRY